MKRSILAGFLFAALCLPTTPSSVSAKDTKKAKTADTTEVNFRKVWPLFQKHKCNVCHTPSKSPKGTVIPPPANLDMSSSAKAYKSLVGVQSMQAKKGIQRVNNTKGYSGALRVAYSYLVYKLLGNHRQYGNIKGKGAQMPPVQHGMDHSDVREIIQWISDGAKY
ncbi:MAG: hypothetical protein EP343_26310 [Deltaproteobacteria bacterium]|nr:MAG: hypothetical protein EP343_26310 [Deltaproteobacteria bacterium]